MYDPTELLIFEVVVNKNLKILLYFLRYGTVSFSQKHHENCHCFPVCHMNGKDNCSDMYENISPKKNRSG